MSPSSESLQDLQVRLTFLDDAVNDLTSADAELSRRLSAIEQALQTMHVELTSLRSAVGHDPAGEPPPPHY